MLFFVLLFFWGDGGFGVVVFLFLFFGGFFIGVWGFFALIMTCINLRVPLCNDKTVALNQK